VGSLVQNFTTDEASFLCRTILANWYTDSMAYQLEADLKLDVNSGI